MKARLKNNVGILDKDKIVNADGKTLKIDDIEMEIIKMLKDGVPFYPIQNYIVKNYKMDKAEYKKRFMQLFNKLSKFDFIEN